MTFKDHFQVIFGYCFIVVFNYLFIFGFSSLINHQNMFNIATDNAHVLTWIVFLSTLLMMIKFCTVKPSKKNNSLLACHIYFSNVEMTKADEE